MENCVKRCQRLEGEDHFLSSERPEQKERDEFDETPDPIQLSTLRVDDIDVYTRLVTYREKLNIDADKFIDRIKWTPISNRFDIYSDSIQEFQDFRNDNIRK